MKLSQYEAKGMTRRNSNKTLKEVFETVASKGYYANLFHPYEHLLPTAKRVCSSYVATKQSGKIKCGNLTAG